MKSKLFLNGKPPVPSEGELSVCFKLLASKPFSEKIRSLISTYYLDDVNAVWFQFASEPMLLDTIPL
jgi:hypothetical protein